MFPKRLGGLVELSPHVLVEQLLRFNLLHHKDYKVLEIQISQTKKPLTNGNICNCRMGSVWYLRALFHLVYY